MRTESLASALTLTLSVNGPLVSIHSGRKRTRKRSKKTFQTPKKIYFRFPLLLLGVNGPLDFAYTNRQFHGYNPMLNLYEHMPVTDPWVFFQKIRTNDGVMLTTQAASLLGDMMSQLHLISIKAGLLPLKFELKNVR